MRGLSALSRRGGIPSFATRSGMMGPVAFRAVGGMKFLHAIRQRFLGKFCEALAQQPALDMRGRLGFSMYGTVGRISTTPAVTGDTNFRRTPIARKRDQLRTSAHTKPPCMPPPSG